LTVRRPSLDRLHKTLEGEFRLRTGMDVSIEVKGFPPIDQRPQESKVVFVLQPEPELPEFADRAIGGRTPVVPLRRAAPEVPVPWVSWFEEWIKGTGEQYSLKSVGWTFFWGMVGPRKVQLLRAEWAHGATARAAQPHWHLDRVIPLSEVVPQDMTVEGSEQLVELEGSGQEPQGARPLAVDVSALHLGMAGWHRAGGYPTCWQQPFPQQWQELERELVPWFSRSLECVTEQIPELANGLGSVL
jgi:hypothetical protein